MRYVLSTRHGWVTWIDGSPPQVAVSESKPDWDSDAELDSLINLNPTSPPSGKIPPTFVLSLLQEPQRAMPAPSEVLRAVGVGEARSLRLVFRGTDPLRQWRETESWIVALEKYLSESAEPIGVHYDFYSALLKIPKRFWAFCARRLGQATVVVRDTGRADPAVARLRRQASRLTDFGIRMRPLLCLTCVGAGRWAESAETWRHLCPGESVSFVRPSPDPRRPAGALALLPHANEVAEFLCRIYDGKKHDLWCSYPFSWLLGALNSGTAAIAQCGSPNRAAIGCDGAVWRCEHGLEASPIGPQPSCDCTWACFCDVVSARCPALRRAAQTDEWVKWERLYCHAVNALMPKIFEDIAAVARVRVFLASRSTDERFRVASGDGALRIWREKLSSGSPS